MSQIPIISQAEALKLFSYDPQSGELRCRITRGSRAIAGTVAGSLHMIKGKYRYIVIRVKLRLYYAHRLIYLMQTGEWPTQIDHKNHDGMDNRWSNLRAASYLINGKNCRLSSNNTSGQMGVNWDKARNKWRARIKVCGKDLFLGRFITFNDAVKARKMADRKYGFHPNHGSET